MRKLAVVLLSAWGGVACFVPPTAGNHRQEAMFHRGVPVIDALINEQQVRCVVDTGDPGFAVSTRFGGSPFGGFGTPEVVDVTIEFAGWRFTGGALTITDTSLGRLREELGTTDVDCVLGVAVLGALRVTIDPAGGFIDAAEIGSPLSVPGGLQREVHTFDALWYDGLMVGTATLQDDLDAIVVLSTGRPGVSLTTRALADLSARPGLAGEPGRERGRLSAVTIDGLDEEDVPVERRDDLGYDELQRVIGLRVDGAVGAAFLSNYVSTWDFESGQVSLRAYSESVESAQREALAAELRAAGW